MYSAYCITIVGGDCNFDLTSISISFLNGRTLWLAPLKQGRVGSKYTFRSIDFYKWSLLDYICVTEYLSNDVFTLEVKSNCLYEISYHYPVFI